MTQLSFTSCRSDWLHETNVVVHGLRDRFRVWHDDLRRHSEIYNSLAGPAGCHLTAVGAPHRLFLVRTWTLKNQRRHIDRLFDDIGLAISCVIPSKFSQHEYVQAL